MPKPSRALNTLIPFLARIDVGGSAGDAEGGAPANAVGGALLGALGKALGAKAGALDGVGALPERVRCAFQKLGAFCGGTWAATVAYGPE